MAPQPPRCRSCRENHYNCDFKLWPLTGCLNAVVFVYCIVYFLDIHLPPYLWTSAVLSSLPDCDINATGYQLTALSACRLVCWSTAPNSVYSVRQSYIIVAEIVCELINCCISLAYNCLGSFWRPAVLTDWCLARFDHWKFIAEQERCCVQGLNWRSRGICSPHLQFEILTPDVGLPPRL